MRNISLSLAALALVLAGSLTAVAQTTSLERQYREERSDYAALATSTVVADASAGVYDNMDQYRDSTGHPLPGWQNTIYG
jgi:hypothetical protein